MTTRAIHIKAFLVLVLGCGSGQPSAPDAGGGADDAAADASPAGDAATTGSEHGTDEPVMGPAAASQVRVAIARAESGYLFVWEDERRDEGGDIFGARMTAAGEVLDPVGLPIDTFSGTQEAPRVASDGAGYLVVWTDWRLLGLSVFATRVSADGEVLDADGFQVAFGTDPDVAFDGTNYVVVWQSGSDVWTARVSPAGEVLDAGGVLLCGADGEQTRPTVTVSSAGTLVAWADGREGAETPDIYAGRLSASGEPIDGCGVRIAHGGGGAVRLAFDGTQYWAVWEGTEPGSTAGLDVFAARIGTDASAIDAQPIALARAAGTQGGPAAAFDGEHVLVAWHQQTDPDDSYAYDIRALRLDGDGGIVDAEPIVISAEPGQQARPFVLAQGGSTWVAWDGDSAEPWEIYATRVEGEVVDQPGGQRITGSANAQLLPRIVRDGDQQLLVWSDHRTPHYTRTFAQHIEASGAPRSEAVHALSPAERWSLQPAVSGDDPSLVCYATWFEPENKYGIAATRVGTSDGAMDPAGIVVVDRPDYHFEPAVASDGTGYLVVWEAEMPEHEYSTIYAARVTSSGEVLDPGGFLVSGADDAASSPAVAYGDGVFLVAWYRLDPPWYDQGATIEVAVVTPEGEVVSHRDLGSPDPARDKTHPKVAFDGESFLVVWELHLHTGWNIYATRVTPASEPLDAQGIAITDSVAEDGVLYIDPAVVFDGTDYVIGWEDEYLTGLQVTRLGTDGQLVDAEPRIITAEPLGQRRVDLAVTAGGEATAAYERFDSSVGTWRVFQRRLTW